MLNDLFILKNGLPIYTINLVENETPSKISATRNNDQINNNDQITMMSGFFSAINSFAVNVGNWGVVKELKMTTDIKFSFYKHFSDNILFVSSSTKHTDHHVIEMILKKIAEEFFQRYPDIEEKKWGGNTNIFDNFDFVVENVINDTKSILKTLDLVEDKPKKNLTSLVLSNQNTNENINEKELFDSDKKTETEKILMKHLSNKILTEKIQINNLKDKRTQEIAFHKAQTENFLPYSKDLFYKLTPIKRNASDGEIYDFFSGEDSKKVFKNINGMQNIEKIGNLTGLSNDRVLSLCKCFIKMGLVSFTK